MDSDNENHIPSGDELQFIAECDAAEDIFEPLPPDQKRPPKRKPKKKKQMSLKKGLKNMKERNFQGYEVERCITVPSLDNKLVFLPKNYGGKTRRKYKNRHAPSYATQCCRFCFLTPCSMIEFKDDLSKELHADNNWLLPDDKALDKVRTRYRTEMMKPFSKTYVLKVMPKNHLIPQCALSGTLELVEDSGYDSLLDDSPFTSDKKLNRLDNDRELAEYKKAVDGKEDTEESEEEYEF